MAGAVPRALRAALALVLCSSHLATHALIVLEPADVAGVYPHVTATFGPRLPTSAGVEGNVSMAVPEDCCSTVAGPAAPDTIILCRRGNCDFVQKVRMAQEAGAIAVVVANDQGEHLFKMYSSDENTADINVPSVFVTTNTGGVIPNTIVMLNATGEYNFNDDSIMHPYFFMAVILLGLSVTLACTLTATLAGYLVMHLRKRRERGECRRLVTNLKTRTFRAPAEGDSASEDAPSCIICLEEFHDGDVLRMLPCGHEYHRDCIDPWLLEKSTACPMCKQNITSGADLHLAGREGAGDNGLAGAQPEPAPMRYQPDEQDEEGDEEDASSTAGSIQSLGRGSAASPLLSTAAPLEEALLDSERVAVSIGASAHMDDEPLAEP